MPAGPLYVGFHRQTATHRPFQARPPLTDQVVAYVCSAMAPSLLHGSSLSHHNGFTCHGHFAAGTTPCYVFNGITVAIARGEVLQCVDTRWVFAQGFLNHAE